MYLFLRITYSIDNHFCIIPALFCSCKSKLIEGRTMKLELPLETWTDVYGFVPRSQLKQLVPHFGEEITVISYLFGWWGGRKCQQTIGDRQFISFVQFFLHKCGEVTLGRLHIKSSTNGNGPIVIANEKNRELPMADVPIPENVKNFESIRISNFDQSVIVFLQKFQQNSLLNNVNLYFYPCPDIVLQIIMTNFLSLFTTINSITMSSIVLDQLQSEYSELATPMLTSARILHTFYNCHNVWFSDWLQTPREDGKARILFLDGYNQQGGRLFSLSHFIKHIKKDFLEANQAVSFLIYLKYFRDEASVQSLTLENGQTQEKLVIKGKTELHDHDYVTISRCSMGTNEEEFIKVMCQHPTIHKHRSIEFDPL